MRSFWTWRPSRVSDTLFASNVDYIASIRDPYTGNLRDGFYLFFEDHIGQTVVIPRFIDADGVNEFATHRSGLRAFYPNREKLRIRAGGEFIVVGGKIFYINNQMGSTYTGDEHLIEGARTLRRVGFSFFTDVVVNAYRQDDKHWVHTSTRGRFDVDQVEWRNRIT